MSIAIDIRGIEKIHAEIESAVKRRKGFLIFHITPHTPNCQAPKLIVDTSQPVRPSARY